jgi:hypothetical protein
MHGDQVTQTVLKISGPGKRGVRDRAGTGFLIFWFPPAAVDCVYDCWTCKAEGTIPVTVYPVLNHYGEVLVAA